MEVSDFLLTDSLIAEIQNCSMRVILQCYPDSVEDLKPALDLAARSNALMINAHAAHPHMSEDKGVELIMGLVNAASEAGLPLAFETHRGRITQDLFRTVALVKKVPEMLINLDVSHYIISEEAVGPADRLKPLLSELLDRVAMMHGRISNGQQIQVDCGDGTGDLPQLYRRFWGEAMRRWRLRNPPGSAFVFTPELGAPDYAITDLQGREFSDRWAQSMVIRGLAEAAWKDSAQVEITNY